MLKKGFEANVITFNFLVRGLCLEGKIVEAAGLFRMMGRLGCEPYMATCVTLINGLCRTGNAKAALRLHRELDKGKLGFCVKPNLLSYTTLIDGLC